MELHTSIAELRAALEPTRRAGASVGLVPTMGYLHDGHLSLMRRSVGEVDTTVVTIFVNPLQFAAGEDLERYPRDLEGDLSRCEAAGVDHVFAPGVDDMYPERTLTTVHVDELGDDLEGATRPGHFDGVTTVVAKLFSIVGGCRAYFGEKDYQQLLLVTRMARDLDLDVEVVGCPIVRELDGVAMSSRNVYLSPQERAAAVVLVTSLRAGAAAIAAGETDPTAIEHLVRAVVDAEPLATLDYAAVRDARTLRRPDVLAGELRILVAAKLGATRLLDNLGARSST